MFHPVRLPERNISSLMKQTDCILILTDVSCSSICKSLSRSLMLNDARLVLFIAELLEDVGTSSSIGRLARLGNPANAPIPPSVVRLFVEVLAPETAGFSG